jgi:hypothetical protein
MTLVEALTFVEELGLRLPKLMFPAVVRKRQVLSESTTAETPSVPEAASAEFPAQRSKVRNVSIYNLMAILAVEVKKGDRSGSPFFMNTYVMSCC